MTRLNRIGQRIIPFAADHYVWIASVLALCVLVEGLRRADDSVRSYLHLAAYAASADVAPLFRNLDATGSFSDREILQLTSFELHAAAESWRTTSPHMSLQVIGLRQKLLYDSRKNTIQSYGGTSSARALVAMALHPDMVRHADQIFVMSADHKPAWILRTLVTRSDYLALVRWNLLYTLFICLVIFVLCFFPHLYRESVLGRSHYDALIRIASKAPSALETEEQFVERLPEFVREILAFDSVAVYWRSDDRLALRAVASRDHHDAAALAKRMERDPITSATHAAEDMAASQNRLTVTKRRGWRRDVHIQEPEGMRDANYIVAPIYDPKQRQVVGLLTAERLRELEPGDRDAVINLASLIMILVDTARSSVEREQDFHRMITLTRQVALGTVVPVLMHNVHTPLSAVCMMARDLGEKWQRMDSAKINRVLAQIDSQTASCLALFDTITDYRLIGVSSAPGANAQAADLYDVLGKICAFFTEYLRLHRIRLVSHFQSDYRPLVKIKPEDLQQVMTNLIINADQALTEMGLANKNKKIEISVSAGEDPDGAVVRVSDNGPGIAARHRDSIFDEGFTTKKDGTGAGLAHAKKVIRWAGGSFDLDHTHEPGASFKIFLPTIERGFN